MTRFFETISAAFGAVFGFIFGGLDGLLYALLAFVVIDYVTGFLVAVATKSLCSECGFKGISKKVLIFALVGVANIVDIFVIKQGTTFRTATIFFYMANEGISIIENAGQLGLPLPNKLKGVLKQLNMDNDGEDKEEK